MIFEQDILDSLEDVGTVAWQGETWRVVLGGRNPLIANRTGARWNPPDTAALYTSTERDTVLAELEHLRGLQTPPVKRSLYTLHVIRVEVHRMVDLTAPNLLEVLGVPADGLASDDFIPCQRVGGAAAWLGCDALLVPSARGPGNNVVVFVDQQEPDALLEAVAGEALSD